MTIVERGPPDVARPAASQSRMIAALSSAPTSQLCAAECSRTFSGLPTTARSQLSPGAVLRPRGCRPRRAGRVVRSARWAWSPLAERIRRCRELVRILRTPELLVVRVGGLDPSPAVRLHTGPIDLFGADPVFRRFGLPDAVRAIVHERTESAIRRPRFPVVLAAAGEEAE